MRIVAWGFGLAATAGLVLGFPVAMLLAAADPRRQTSADDAVALFLLAAVILLAPALLGAIGTLRGKRWGPVALGFVAMLMLFAVPVGTVLGGLSLWVLAPAMKRCWAQQRDANAAAAAYAATPCEHLRPILAAMQQRGIRLHAPPRGRVTADCTIDLLALARWRGGLAPLQLSAPTPDERTPAGARRTLLWCDSCRCGIGVAAPGPWAPTVPIFPGPAA